MQIHKNQKIRISPEVLFQEVNGEMVLLDLASEKYFGLDEVGAQVWNLLKSGNDLERIVETLLEEYEVDEATLESDIGELIDKLVEAGLIGPAQAPENSAQERK